jgi:hypothetical protein
MHYPCNHTDGRGVCPQPAIAATCASMPRHIPDDTRTELHPSLRWYPWCEQHLADELAAFLASPYYATSSQPYVLLVRRPGE